MADPKEVLEVCKKVAPGPWEVITGEWEGGWVVNKTLTFNDLPLLTIVTSKGNVEISPLTAEVKIDDGVLINEAAEIFWNAIRIQGKSLVQRLQQVEKELEGKNANLRAVAEAAKRLYEICLDMPIDFPSAGPLVWGMGDLKEALIAAGYGGKSSAEI